LPLTDLKVTITPDRATSSLRIRAEAATTAQTGVEMEAMTACAVAALCIYDMTKGIDATGQIESVVLLEKEGGKSGHWVRP
jgi:cyclic pyranopterin phosphate synthase